MMRFIGLIVFCTVALGALITFQVPMDWIGHLPGDFSLDWGEMHIFIPISTAVGFSLVLSAFLFLFARR